MQKIAEPTMLLRQSVQLPDDLKIVTEAFQGGWSFMRSGDASWLDEQIQLRGWSFAGTEDGLLRSGVGKTSQEAIANALQLALIRVGEQFNAVEAKHFHLSWYPGITIARVRVFPCQIQPGSVVAPAAKPHSCRRSFRTEPLTRKHSIRPRSLTYQDQ